MIIRCPGCDTELEYNKNSKNMVCTNCGMVFQPNESEAEETADRPPVKIRCYRCKSCGADLVTNDQQSTSVCFFCGDTGVMEETRTDFQEPDFLLPFSISQKQAEQNIRRVFRKSWLIPGKMKHFQTELLTPIYVPFWLMKLEYGDTQKWNYVVKRSKYSGYETRCVNVSGTVKMSNFALNASNLLDDDAAQRLGPYRFDELLPYDPVHLAGRYADRFDLKKRDVEETAYHVVKRMYDWYMQGKVARYSKKLSFSHPHLDIGNAQRAFLPVWFLRLRSRNKQYTVLVNGQTGKVVTTMPPAYLPACGAFLGMTAVGTALLGSLMTGIGQLAFGMTGYYVGETLQKAFVLLLLALTVGTAFVGGKNVQIQTRKNKEYLMHLGKIDGNPGRLLDKREDKVIEDHWTVD